MEKHQSNMFFALIGAVMLLSIHGGCDVLHPMRKHDQRAAVLSVWCKPLKDTGCQNTTKFSQLFPEVNFSEWCDAFLVWCKNGTHSKMDNDSIVEKIKAANGKRNSFT